MNNEKKSSFRFGAFIKGIAVGFLLTVLLIGAVLLGSGIVRVKPGKAQSDNSVVETQIEEESLVNEELITKMENLESIIDRLFYLHDVSKEDLEAGIFKGMFQALDDPYSEYYTQEELAELLSQTSGTYYGIGAYVSIDPDYELPKISSVIEGTPAQEAQLRANDIIYMIDGETTYGLTLSEAVSLIKGEENTVVNLTIIREDEQLEIPVTRRKVETPTIKTKMLEDGIGYLQIVEFDDVTADQFAEGMAVLRAGGMKGLVLDLRANPGGNLDTVVEIAQMLLPKGLIVYTEDKAGKRVEYKCDGKRELDIPMTVLVDMNSASAAEILSGAIQDYEKGTLIGTTTFGKGIVQSVMPLPDGTAVKITVSSYYTPKGRNIHGTGIEPDIICEFDGDTYYQTNGEKDNQIDKAVEVLKLML